MVWGVCLCAAVMTNSRLLLEKRRNSAKQVPLGDCGATEEGRKQTMRAWPHWGHGPHCLLCSCNMMCIFQFSFTTVSCKGAALNILPKGLWNQRCDPFFGASGKQAIERLTHLVYDFSVCKFMVKRNILRDGWASFHIQSPSQFKCLLVWVRLYRPRISLTVYNLITLSSTQHTSLGFHFTLTWRFPSK